MSRPLQNTVAGRISFVTPYWAGREMMSLHLESLRRFYPDAPILVSSKGDDVEEMEDYRSRFGVQYRIEDCNYVDAMLRLLERCTTDIVCIMDHDTVLLDHFDDLIAGIVEDQYDLVGIEERIREPAALLKHREAGYHGWMRFAPGACDATFMMFNVRAFLDRFGLKAVRGRRIPGAWDHEYHYGICQRLPRHHYLRPYHVPKYGLGNLVQEGDRQILWHQWFGSYRVRLAGPAAEVWTADLDATIQLAQDGETHFLNDFPALDLTGMTPAWGPEFDIATEQRAAERQAAGFFARAIMHWRIARRLGPGWFVRRIAARIDRWRRVFHRAV